MANNNSGADALIGRILADAQAEADAALADADKEAERIALIAKDERFRIENETAQKTKRLNDAAQEKSRTNAALDSRKYALKVKRALIDEAFALAAERMEQKSDEERSALIKALLIREAEGGEMIIPAARDEANVKSVLAEVNAALAQSNRAPLTIAPADADITGGFILKAAGIRKELLLRGGAQGSARGGGKRGSRNTVRAIKSKRKAVTRSCHRTAQFTPFRAYARVSAAL